MSGDKQNIQVAVVGVGRMGRHHARLYNQLKNAELVAVVDADGQRCRDVADEFDCDACPDLPQLLSRHRSLRAVTVAVPTVHHVRVAKPLLERGIACLVEKPLAASPDEAQYLAELASASTATLQVGHTERFNPAVRAVVAMDITPRFMEIHRVGPMTFRSLDIGVVMDMMIHDLDIALMFANAPLVQVDAAGVAVLGEHEDVVNARLVFESGCVANVTASRLALKTERKMRVFSEQAYVTLDYHQRSGLVIHKRDNADALAQVRARLAEGADLSGLDYGELVRVEPLTMDLAEGEEDPLTAELISFLDAVRYGHQPLVDGWAGCAAVAVSRRVEEAVAAHQWVGLTQPSV